MGDIPHEALVAGFEVTSSGVHDSKTMMLAELRRLLEACPAGACPERYRAAAVEENVLLKQSLEARKGTFERLHRLYILDRHVLLFRALRDLWDSDGVAQPLLALLCALARDPILRQTAPLILEAAPGKVVTWQMLAGVIKQDRPDRYSPVTLAAFGKHIASSWTQSDHLQGKPKTRTLVEARPASVAYALLLGHLCGNRGDGLFETLWARLLDTPPHLLRQQAVLASQAGWIDYRHAGGVTDIGFSYLLRPEESRS